MVHAYRSRNPRSRSGASAPTQPTKERKAAGGRGIHELNDSLGREYPVEDFANEESAMKLRVIEIMEHEFSCSWKRSLV